MSGRDRTLARNNSLDPLGKDPGSPGPSPRRGPGNPKETLRNATPSSLYVDATSMSLASGQVTNWWSLAIRRCHSMLLEFGSILQVAFLPVGRASRSLGSSCNFRFLGLGRDTLGALTSSFTSSREASKLAEIESRD